MKDRSSPKPPTDAKSRLGPAKASCLPRAVGGIQGRLAPKKYEEEVVRKEFKRITPSRETPTIKTSASLAKRLGEKKVSSDDRLARERFVKFKFLTLIYMMIKGSKIYYF